MSAACALHSFTLLMSLATGSAFMLPSQAPTMRLQRHHPRSPTPEMVTVSHFLKDLEFLGPCRFVVQGNGAILEAIGAFESLRENANGLATVSNDDNTFECHIKLAEIKRAAFVKKESGERTLHVVRLQGAEGNSLLSAILAPEQPGESVEAGAIEFWESLRTRFGDEVNLEDDVLDA